MLCGLLLFLADGTALQIVCGLIVTFVSFGAFAYWRPFASHGDTVVEIVSLATLFMVLLSGLLFRTGVAGDGDDAEISGAAMTPLMIGMIVLPILTMLFIVQNDVRGAMDTAQETRRGVRASFSNRAILANPSTPKEQDDQGVDNDEDDSKKKKKKKKRKSKRGSEMRRDSDAGRLAASPPLPAAPSPHVPDGLCERLGLSWCSSSPPAPTPSEPVDFKQVEYAEPQGDAAVSLSMEV